MSTITKSAPVARAAATSPKRDTWDPVVTVLHHVKATKSCSHVRLSEVVAKIRGRDLEAQTTEIRRLRAERRGTDADEEKKKLPAFIVSGMFSPAADAGFQKHSGLAVIDFDRIPADRLEPFRAMLAVDPHTANVFTSSSGVGVKWLVSVNATDRDSHKACYKAVMGYVTRSLPELAKYICEAADLSRKCFLSHDPRIISVEPTESFEPEELGLSAKCETDLQTSGLTDLRTSSHSLLLFSPSSGSPITAHGLLNSNDPKLRDRIQKLSPVGGHQNDTDLFRLGRLCRDLEHELGLDRFQLSKTDRRTIITIWLEVTPKQFRRHSDSDYRDEFTQKFLDAKLGLDSVPWRIAWDQSRTEPPPSWWCHMIEDPEPKRLRLLTMLYIQAAFTGGTVIAPRDRIAAVAKEEGYVELDHPEKVDRVLKGFRPTLALITKASKTPPRAAEYRLNVPKEWVAAVGDSRSVVQLSPAEIIL